MKAFDIDRKYLEYDAEKKRLDDLAAELKELTFWQPASGLLDIIGRKQKILDDARARFESKPVISVVGPSGSGKSTLVNALVNTGDLLTMGYRRPTTRTVAVVSRFASDARQLTAHIGADDIQIKSCSKTMLPDAIIVDTPDTDSGECEHHRPLLDNAIQLTDILICVFDAANPKRSDNIRAIEDWVMTFPGDQIIMVLNRCDRIPEDELTSLVLPDFKKHIASAWARKADKVFCVSARSGLDDPEWPEGEQPLHRFNQLSELQNHLQNVGSGAFFVDRRIERARHINRVMADLTAETAGKHAQDLMVIQKEIQQLEQDIVHEGLKAISKRTGEDGAGLAGLLCGAMAQRWWGPVGLFVGIWRRMVDFRAPFSFVRSLNPANFVTGIIRSVRALGNPEGLETHVKNLLSDTLTGAESPGTQLAITENWPDIADKLVRAGFRPSVRNADKVVDLTPLLQISRDTWRKALDDAVETTADRLSHPLLQWILNAPVLIIVGVVVWKLISEFLGILIMPASFLFHSMFLLLLFWLLPSWFLQWRTVKARARLTEKARQNALKTWQDNASANSKTGIMTVVCELDRVVRLGAGETEVE
jgi:GTPase SAR1 family protein